MSLTIIDTETIPDQTPGAEAAILAELEAPARMSKAETIAKWREEQAPAAAHEKWLKTAIDPWAGELACIAWGPLDGETISLARDLQGSEAELLAAFWGAMRAEMGVPEDGTGEYRYPTFCGHNVRFDLRFLWVRSVIHGLRPPVPVPHDVRPYAGRYVDTMFMATGSDSGQDKFMSLPRLCQALGIEEPEDIDGSAVWEAMQRGDVGSVAHHCRADVDRVRDVYRRLTFTETSK